MNGPRRGSFHRFSTPAGGPTPGLGAGNILRVCSSRREANIPSLAYRSRGYPERFPRQPRRASCSVGLLLLGGLA